MSKETSAPGQLYRLLSESVTDFSIILLDPDGLIVSWTAGAESLEGYSAGEVLGHHHSVFHLPESIERGEPRRLLEEAAKVGKVESEGWRVRKNGERYFANVVLTATRNEQGELTGFIRIARDLSARQQAMEALRASEQRFRKILETAGEGIVIRDPDGAVTFANERMAEMLGYKSEELLGRNVFDLVAPEYREKARERAQRRAQGISEQFDMEFVRKDGRRAWAIVSSSPMYDASGKYVAALAMVTDITERKELEQQLRQSQKIEAVGRLAGGVAHDFNNLLTAINGHAELLLAEVSDDNPLRTDIEEIRNAAGRAATLTRQLLAFSRQQILQPQVLELDLVVREMQKVLAQLIGEGAQLIVQPRAPGTRVRADRGQIEQVLMNLAVNARDAMPDGGLLMVETEECQLDEAFVAANPGSAKGAHVKLTVRDTGAGMDAETLSHIFEPFFTTKELGRGTGLGLATVYGIVKQSGGHIRVWSETNRGTTFEIFLPVVTDPIQPQRSATGPLESVEGETVLVAEDEDAVRALASRILRKRGYHVLEARHGAEAIEIARAHHGRIDVLLTDVVMPFLGGRELGEKLEQMRPGVKVLYMSGYTGDALRQRGGLDAGPGRFLEKPFTPEVLVNKIREVLESQ